MCWAFHGISTDDLEQYIRHAGTHKRRVFQSVDGGRILTVPPIRHNGGALSDYGVEMLIPLLNPGRAKMALLNPGRTRLLGAVAGGRASILPLFCGVLAGVHLFSGGFGGGWF